MSDTSTWPYAPPSGSKVVDGVGWQNQGNPITDHQEDVSARAIKDACAVSPPAGSGMFPYICSLPRNGPEHEWHIAATSGGIVGVWKGGRRYYA